MNGFYRSMHGGKKSIMECTYPYANDPELYLQKEEWVFIFTFCMTFSAA